MEVWRPGEVILDLYEVLDVVRAGGMGLVHRVRHRGWGIDLAVKTPRRALVRSPAAIRDFEREAEVWVGLGLHPHIANCVYVRSVDEVPRVFAEWADGGSLADAVRDRSLYRGNALGAVLDVAVQIAWGLDHAHENHVVHQDVKPANVLLTADGSVKVTDFGMARAQLATGEAAGADDAGPFVSRGGLTVAYCSPEQAAAPGRLTTATDVWSWAITVLEMFLGRPPGADGTSAGNVLDGVTRSGGADAALPMPPEVADLLRECFTADPAARPARLGPLAERLVRLHEREVGPYRRRTPSAATLLADGLSNHALSLLDLGRPESAEELWARALRADPNHLHAGYNRGLHRWRAGVITDAQLVDELESVRSSGPGDGSAEHLLGLVHRERGDPVAAAALLREALARLPGDQIADALASIEDAPAPAQAILPGDHEDWVSAVALTADGRVAVSADRSGGVRVWDVAAGECRQQLRLEYQASALAVRDDGRRVVVAGDVGRALVLDLDTGAVVELPGHRSWVSLAAVTADQRHAVTHEIDGATVTWDLDTGEPVRTRRFARADVLGAAGTLCSVIDYRDSTNSVHDVRTGELVHRFERTTSGVVFSGDGRIAAAAAGSTDVRLVDLRSGEAGPLLHTGFGRIAVDLDGTVGFSSGGRDTPSTVWDLRTGRCRLSLDATPDTKDVVLSANGQVAVTSEGKSVRAWRLPPAGPPAPWSYVRPRGAPEIAATAARAAELLADAVRLTDAGRLDDAAAHIRAARALPGHQRSAELASQWRRLGASGRRTELADAWPAGRIAPLRTRSWALEFTGRSPTAVARNGNDSDVWVFDVETGRLLHTLSLHTGFLGAVAMTSDGSLAVSGGEDGRVAVWRPPDGQLVHSFASPRDRVWQVAVSDDGRVALAGTADGQVVAWDLGSGRAIGGWQAHAGAVLDVAVSADHRYGISRGEDVSVQVWDLRAATLRCTLRGHAEWIGAARLSDHGEFVVTGGADAAVRVWRTRDGRCGAVLSGHTDAIVDVVPSPDARQALSCSVDGDVRLWDVAGRRCLRVLRGHTALVHCLAVTPDFRLAASGGEDRTVRLWDLSTGALLRTLTGHVGPVTAVALSPDGAVVRSGSESGHLLTWALDWEYDFSGAASARRRWWRR